MTLPTRLETRMPTHPLAGQSAPKSILANIPRLMSAYYTLTPDPANPDQAVAFGTSGHRGVSTKGTFNEHHILAISQAIADYRGANGIHGPLFLGMDTHALSEAGLRVGRRGARRQPCHRHDPGRRGLHTHARDLARHPRPQRPQDRAGRRRHRHHPLAQPA
jgi:hypothetical protein